jgi:hypothetical protein
MDRTIKHYAKLPFETHSCQDKHARLHILLDLPHPRKQLRPSRDRTMFVTSLGHPDPFLWMRKEGEDN